MTSRTFKTHASTLILLAMAAASAGAQGQQPGNSKKLLTRSASDLGAKSKAQTATAHADAPSYLYTLISFPGTLSTLGVGINPGALHERDENPGVEIVGAEFFPDDSSQTGFRAHASRFDGVTENYKLLNDAQLPTPQQAYSINDHGQVVGDFIDANGMFHSYKYDCGHFQVFNVPFTGATGTYSPAINNDGEIVGSWNDSAGNAHSYTLINGKFVSFDVPGSSQSQFYYGINSQGDLTGSYADAAGNVHGFLRKAGNYTTLDYPKAVYTVPSGINDAGDIVGGYCLTTQCTITGEGELGFILSKGVYSTVTIPGEYAVGLASINNHGVIMGNYIDAAGLIYTFLGTPSE